MTEDRRLPCGWTWATVGDLAADLRYGTSAKTSADVGDMPVLRMGNLSSSGELLLESLKYLSAHHPDMVQATLSSGDVLFNRTNSIELVGKSAVYRGQIAPCSFASYLIRVRLSSACIPEYLVACLNSPRGKRWARTVASQQVGQANINGSKLREFRVPLAPLSEQRRIVDEIGTQSARLDSAVTSLQRALVNVRRFKASVLHAATNGQFAGEPTAQWNRCILDAVIAEVRNGISIKPSADEGLPILRISAVRPLSVDLQDVRFLSAEPETFERYRLRDGDLLLTRYNGNPEYVGVAGRVFKLSRVTVYPDKLIRLRLRDDSQLLPEFLEVVLNAGPARTFLRSRVRTTAGQAGISGADVRATPIAFPSLDAQRTTIAEVQRRMSVIDETAESINADLTRASRLRQAILERAFKGELVPQEPGDETASALLLRLSESNLGGDRRTRSRPKVKLSVHTTQEQRSA
jgi:type I restriction enzyme, S subunit